MSSDYTLDFGCQPVYIYLYEWRDTSQTPGDLVSKSPLVACPKGSRYSDIVSRDLASWSGAGTL